MFPTTTTTTRILLKRGGVESGRDRQGRAVRGARSGGGRLREVSDAPVPSFSHLVTPTAYTHRSRRGPSSRVIRHNERIKRSSPLPRLGGNGIGTTEASRGKSPRVERPKGLAARRQPWPRHPLFTVSSDSGRVCVCVCLDLSMIIDHTAE